MQELAGFKTPGGRRQQNLKVIMDGLKDILTAGGSRKADTMTVEILKDVSPHVDRENHFELCVYTGMLIAFCLVLRKSNLVPESGPTFNPTEQFTWNHMIVDREAELLMFNIEWSKTDPHHEENNWVPAVPSDCTSICPVEHAYLLKQKTRPKASDPFLSFRNKKGELKPLTYAQLGAQMKKWVAKTGRQADRFTTHCLRRGGASHAFNAGLNTDYIKLLGNWGSECLLGLHFV